MGRRTRERARRRMPKLPDLTDYRFCDGPFTADLHTPVFTPSGKQVFRTPLWVRNEVARRRKRH